MPDIDVIVVGAGVVGLAIARELSLADLSVVVLEASGAIGTETSSRNSEVIHGGLYYPKHSLKARLCIEGRELLYDYCSTHHIPHSRCGKLVVATSGEEVGQLENLLARGHANGCRELELISRNEALSMEGALQCEAALFSPKTGIIDSHSYMLALRGDAEDAGVGFAFFSPFKRAQKSQGQFTVDAGNGEETQITSRFLINSAGLHASEVASKIVGMPQEHVPATKFAKGNYFSLRGRNPFTHLIYPTPQIHGLGVHLTFDLAGQVKFGPDVEWVEEMDYQVNHERGQQFYGEIRKYWPGLQEGALSPAYAGIRPKISGPRDAAQDFRIDGPDLHGIDGLINLFGIESPGLTASLAIARQVRDLCF